MTRVVILNHSKDRDAFCVRYFCVVTGVKGNFCWCHKNLKTVPTSIMDYSFIFLWVFEDFEVTVGVFRFKTSRFSQ